MSDNDPTKPPDVNRSLPSSNGRLSSFGKPRDLTLGGLPSIRGGKIGLNKKVYTPNLNVTRNKNVNVKTSKDTTRNYTRRNDNTRSTRGGRPSINNNLVQTTSLFSEGCFGPTVKRSSESYRTESRRTDDFSLQKPRLSKNRVEVDVKAQALHLKSVLGDDAETKDNFEGVDLLRKPIEYNDQENLGLEENFNICLDEDLEKFKKDFFESNDKKVFFVQLPSILPFEGSDDTGIDNDSKTNKVKDDNHKDLQEGLCGKLVRYKSGKCKLVLGTTPYNVTIGSTTKSLQEVVSIHSNTKERSSNIINLGSFDTKIIASPDWENLLSKIS